jgi:hypothetical protein
VPVRRLLVVLAFPALMLAACGNSRTPVPDLIQPAVPNGMQTLTYPAAGVTLRAPRNWTVTPGKDQLVVTVASGHVLAALWRFPRTEPLPSTPAALEQARRRLVDAATRRYHRLHMIRSRVLKLAGAHAIELSATERIAGAPRRVRSIHVFKYHAELVLDEYAPPAFFHTVDHQVFTPIKRSLRLGAASGA